MFRKNYIHKILNNYWYDGLSFGRLSGRSTKSGTYRIGASYHRLYGKQTIYESVYIMLNNKHLGDFKLVG